MSFPLICFPKDLGLNGCTASYAFGMSFTYVIVSISFDNTRDRTNIGVSVASLVELLRTSFQLLLASLWWHVWIAMRD